MNINPDIPNQTASKQEFASIVKKVNKPTFLKPFGTFIIINVTNSFKNRWQPQYCGCSTLRHKNMPAMRKQCFVQKKEVFLNKFLLILINAPKK